MATRTRTLISCALIVLLAGSVTGAETTRKANALFNGKDLAGWTIVNDPAKEAATVWTVSDGLLRCAGKPRGYLRTDATYANYRLKLEWRWPEKPGNSGVFVHGAQADKVWPYCYEAQLQAGNAGEIRCNGGARFHADSTADDKSRPKEGDPAERSAGEWNTYEITCQGDRITLMVNGVKKNEIARTALTSGWIGLQAEGAPIEFRNVTLEQR